MIPTTMIAPETVMIAPVTEVTGMDMAMVITVALGTAGDAAFIMADTMGTEDGDVGVMEEDITEEATVEEVTMETTGTATKSSFPLFLLLVCSMTYMLQ